MFPVSLAGTMVRKQNIKKKFDHVGIVHHTGNIKDGKLTLGCLT